VLYDTRPNRCLPSRRRRPLPKWVDDIKATDATERFQQVCRRAFSFLEEELGFRMDPPQPSEPFMAFYRSQALNVVIETLSYGGITRLCLIDRESRLLDVTEMVERRDPELLDGCRLASGYREQIPMFAEALRKCAADVLAGDLQAISREKNVERGFSLSVFFSQNERSRFLASLGPRLRSNVGPD
jgi:hypothetical protein